MEELFWYPHRSVGIPSTFVKPLSEQERLYGRQTSSRSYWSFCTKDDIRYSFNHVSKDVNDKKPDLPERFVDVFHDLQVHINFFPSHVPVTIVWNWYLPCFDSTREDQEFKDFSDLPSDLPFRYGSLTALRTSFRPWIGSDRMSSFDIPGLEFFVTTGKNRFNSECRNPAGTWFRQVIPTGAQLIHLMQEIQNKCIAINDHVPDYDYEDDSLKGWIVLFDKGVHLAPIHMLSNYGVRLPYPTPKTVDPRSSAIILRRVNLSRPSHK